MLELFRNEVVLQHMSVGAFHGLLLAAVFAVKLLFAKNRELHKVFFVRVLQGAASGYLAAIANYGVFQWFGEPSLVVSAVLGSIGGLAGLVFAQAILDKLAKQFKLDLKVAESNLLHNDEVLTKLSQVKKEESSVQDLEKKIRDCEAKLGNNGEE